MCELVLIPGFRSAVCRAGSLLPAQTVILSVGSIFDCLSQILFRCYFHGIVCFLGGRKGTPSQSRFGIFRAINFATFSFRCNSVLCLELGPHSDLSTRVARFNFSIVRSQSCTGHALISTPSHPTSSCFAS